jgi:hypothetical protein
VESADVEFETRAFPNLLVATLATLPFVGDWKIRNDWRDTNTRVFTPDGLLRYIRDQQPQLKRNEIELIASHLERSARA